MSRSTSRREGPHSARVYTKRRAGVATGGLGARGRVPDAGRAVKSVLRLRARLRAHRPRPRVELGGPGAQRIGRAIEGLRGGARTVPALQPADVGEVLVWESRSCTDSEPAPDPESVSGRGAPSRR